MNSLKLSASKEELLKHIGELKIKALNLVTAKLNHEDAQYLEPKEVKILIDTTLVIEDSLRSTSTEGSQARTVQRLLDKYSTPEIERAQNLRAKPTTYIDAVVEEA